MSAGDTTLKKVALSTQRKEKRGSGMKNSVITENYIQYPVINYNRIKKKKNSTIMYHLGFCRLFPWGSQYCWAVQWGWNHFIKTVFPYYFL